MNNPNNSVNLSKPEKAMTLLIISLVEHAQRKKNDNSEKSLALGSDRQWTHFFLSQ